MFQKHLAIPIKIERLARKLGLEIFLCDDERLSNLTGALIINPDLKSSIGSDKVIYIQNRMVDSSEQQRLNIALAIAQYQLGFDPEKDIQYSKLFDTHNINYTGVTPILSRAVELLLPESVLCSKYGKLRAKGVSRYTLISTLAACFAVSCNCVTYRLQELNLDF